MATRLLARADRAFIEIRVLQGLSERHAAVLATLRAGAFLSKWSREFGDTRGLGEHVFEPSEGYASA